MLTKLIKHAHPRSMPAQPAEAPPSSLFGHRSHANVGPLFAGLVTNPTEYSTAQANCAAAAARYSLDRIARQYGDVYAKVLQDPPASAAPTSNCPGSAMCDDIMDVQQQLWIKRQSDLSPDLRNLLLTLTRFLVNRPRWVRLMIGAMRWATRIKRWLF